MRDTFELGLRLWLFLFITGCSNTDGKLSVQTVTGIEAPEAGEIWLSHEHILVDFIGADSIRSTRWDRDSVIEEIAPFLKELENYKVKYFVDATPNFLGRDAGLLQKIANQTGLKVITNTGLYGAVNNKYIPDYAYQKTAADLAAMWIDEFKNGIDGTSVRPGFVKISVDASSELHPIHRKLVTAAAQTHLQTGMTIASHTGKAEGLWPQLEVLKENGVSPESFIWVHAQNEKDNNNYLKAAGLGCWISLDGLGWELEEHVKKLLFAKQHNILDRILISHDAGWYDPQKETQSIKPYTPIFEQLYLELISKGFTEQEFNLLITKNPSEAFSIRIRLLN
ncbi:MAG: phosphotriesterase [Cyclobacteriaceae bacterium]